MKKFCIAYGRNLDLKRMKEKCPHCVLVGKTYLKNWQIAFRKYITLEKCHGKEVPVGIWQFDYIGEKELDVIENFPIMYRKEYVDVEFDGKRLKCLVYLINDSHPKFPDEPYLQRVLIGYNDFGFNKKYINEAISRIPQKKVFILSDEKPTNYIKGCKQVDIQADYGTVCKNINDYDGLLIPGGNDINPKWYGKENIASEKIDNNKDERVFKTISEFVQNNKSILGICGGSQYLNIFFKGTLKQDISNHKDTEHFIISKNSLFTYYLGEKFKVNSLHHQCVETLGENLQICGISEDGIIEAFMDKNNKILGVQWHPEIILGRSGKNVFKIFKTML